MEEVRFLRGEEYNHAALLADATFRDSEQKSMAEGYPQVFSSAMGQSVGFFVNGVLVSFIGVVPQLVRIGPAQLRVLSIGSVCTHPNHRGKGYAGQILSFIKNHARESSVSLLLVSGAGPLYARAGCIPFGSVYHIMMDHDQALAKTASGQGAGICFRRQAPSDLFALQALSQIREVRYEQSLWDWTTLTEAAAIASNMKLEQQVWVAERSGEMMGGVVAAVPSSFKAKCEPMVVEWSGHPQIITLLLAHIVHSHHMNQLHWFAPIHELEPASLSLSYTVNKQLCTVGVVDPMVLLQQLLPYLQSLAGYNAEQIRWSCNDGAISLEYGESRINLDGSQFANVVFNPVEEWPEAIRQELSLRQWFPIPFPHTGGLNYV